MGEEQQQTDEGQENSNSFQIGPEDRELDLRREERAGSRLWWGEPNLVMENSKPSLSWFT